jgi:hypothetical protein
MLDIKPEVRPLILMENVARLLGLTKYYRRVASDRWRWSHSHRSVYLSD